MNFTCGLGINIIANLSSFRNSSNQALDDSNHEIKTKEFLCAECGWICLTKGGLRKHLLSTHGVGKMKHSCNSCEKTFIEKHQLQSHQMTHHGAEMIKCSEPECNKEFASKSSLKRHRENVHENKLFSCSKCLLVYTHRTGLDDHVKAIHTEGFTYRCKYCGASFKWRSSFAKHMKVKH